MNNRHPKHQTQSLYRVQLSGSRDGHVDVWATTPAHAVALTDSYARQNWIRSQPGSVSQIRRAGANPINGWEKINFDVDAG